MPSATLMHSFPVPLGRRGTAAAVVLALHALLVAALITGLVVQIPRVDLVLPPPPVRAAKQPEPPLGRATADLKDTLTLTAPTERFVPPELPPVTTGGEISLLPPEIVNVRPPVPDTTSAVRVLHSEDPPYPAAARRLGEEGAVLLRVLVGADGRAERVEIAASSGSSRLDDAAVASVRRWQFQPARSGAGPIASWTTLRVVFRLTG